MRYAYYASQIKKNTNLINNKKNLILDIGGGYGGLARLLKNIYHDSTFHYYRITRTLHAFSIFFKKKLYQ